MGPQANQQVAFETCQRPWLLDTLDQHTQHLTDKLEQTAFSFRATLLNKQPSLAKFVAVIQGRMSRGRMDQGMEAVGASAW